MDLTAWMEQWNMFPPKGGTILCAVSGGRDSVCLLHYLHGISRERNFSLAVGHYNHHMRPTAQRDEDFVRHLCGELGVPFYTDGCDVVASAARAGLGVEEMGRRLRYEFLEQLADRLGAQRIATAHHMADQAETVLLNLLRGTGPEGLGGIPPVRGRLIRPLLNTPRREIETYLERFGLGHVEDETNESLAFARNRLRKNAMPELEQINGALRQNIARTAAIVRREDDYLNALAAEYLPDEGLCISCERLLAAPEVLRPRVVRLLAKRLDTGKKDWGAVHVEAILELAEREREGCLSLPDGVAAVCLGGVLTLQKDAALNDGALALAEGTFAWNGWRVTVHRVPENVQRKENAVYLKEETLPLLQLDAWRGGEGLKLPASRGRRSIKRLLTERGVPPQERQKIPCVRVGEEPAAVYGVGTDVHYLPENGGMIEIIFERENM